MVPTSDLIFYILLWFGKLPGANQECLWIWALKWMPTLLWGHIFNHFPVVRVAEVLGQWPRLLNFQSVSWAELARHLGLLCSGSGCGLHSPRWPAEGDKPPLFSGRDLRKNPGLRLGPGHSWQSLGLLRAGQCFGFGKMQDSVLWEGS